MNTFTSFVIFGLLWQGKMLPQKQILSLNSVHPTVFWSGSVFRKTIWKSQMFKYLWKWKKNLKCICFLKDTEQMNCDLWSGHLLTKASLIELMVYSSICIMLSIYCWWMKIFIKTSCAFLRNCINCQLRTPMWGQILSCLNSSIWNGTK